MRKIFVFIWAVFCLSFCNGWKINTKKPIEDNGKYGYMYKTESIKSIIDNNGVICLQVLQDNPHYFGYPFSDFAMYNIENPDFNINLKQIYSELLSCFSVSYGQHIGDNLVITGGGKNAWYRDQFARDNDNLLQAFLITEDIKLLRFVENQVDIWLKNVPRKTHKGFNVFPYGIKDIDKMKFSYYGINPNQQFRIANLFSMLYFIPESKFYKNQLFKDIAMNEIEAGLTLQEASGGFFLSEHLQELETNYTGYSTSILYGLAQMWDKPKYYKSIKQAGKWLIDNYSIEKPMSGLEGKPYRDNPYNMIGRIPAFYVAGVNSDYVKQWGDAVINRYTLDKNYLIPFFYTSSTIPISYYNSNSIDIKRKIPPLIYYEDNKLRIYADHIDKVEITYNNGKVYYISKRKLNISKVMDYIEINGGGKIILEKYNINYPVSLELYDCKNIKEKFN